MKDVAAGSARTVQVGGRLPPRPKFRCPAPVFCQTMKIGVRGPCGASGLRRCVFRSQLTGNPESREHLVRKVVNTQSGKSLTPGPENREHPVRKIVNSETEIFRMLFLLYSLRRSLARAGSGIFPPRVAAWPSLAA